MCSARTGACSSSTTTAATMSARSRDPDAPQYRVWSRREGPFLRDGGFKIRVVHCFWTFASVEDAQAFLGEAFGSGARRRRGAAPPAPVLERRRLPPLARRNRAGAIRPRPAAV